MGRIDPVAQPLLYRMTYGVTPEFVMSIRPDQVWPRPRNFRHWQRAAIHDWYVQRPVPVKRTARRTIR